MKVVIDFAQDASVIEFTPFLGEDIKEYLKSFEDWYFETNEYGMIIKKSCHNHYKYFDIDVIMDWIKEVAPESNPRILLRQVKPDEVDPELPGMYF